MDASKIRLLDFIGASKRTFNIPVYQRSYSWKEEECERLFYDIETIAKENFKIRHFLGTVVYVIDKVEPNFTEFILIDGQQRITSIMLLIKVLHSLILDIDKKEDIYETYLINKFADKKYRLKLKSIETDMPVYEAIIEENEIRLNSNLVKNYNFFIELVKGSKYLPEEIYKALSFVDLVYIALDKGEKSENPQLIFESLNSTGMSLMPADLIRNFLLMNCDYERQIYLYKTYWIKIEKYVTNTGVTNFIRDYLTMKTSITPNKTKVYEDFKKYVNLNIDVEEILSELVNYAKIYSWFINCNSNDEKIDNLLQTFVRLKQTVIYPLLLFIFNEYKNNIIDKEQIEKILNLNISYIFRRIICGYPSNTLNRIYAVMPKELKKNVKNNNYYTIMAEILLSKTGTGTFPRDNEFKNKFILKDIYNTKICKYLLENLEMYMSKEVVMMQEIQVEHIMPQKLTPSWHIELGNKSDIIHDKYLHTIGNLSLTGYNSELSNKTFLEKKEILVNSNIALNRQLDNYSCWNENSILNRAEQLFYIALKKWDIPIDVINYEKTSLIDDTIDYNIMEDLNLTGKSPRYIIFFDKEFKVSSWKMLLKVICDILYNRDEGTFKLFTEDKDFSSRAKRIIDNNSDKMISPYEVTKGIFIETNQNANMIMNYVKLMIEKYGLEDDVYYRISK